MGSLTDRVRELAAEAERESEELERQRTRIASERDAAIAEVQERHTRAMRAEVETTRERFRERIGSIDADLSAARRLTKALAPAKPPKPRQPKPTHPGAPSQKWKPSEAVFRAVAEAITDGHEYVQAIADSERVTVSKTSVKLAIDHMRADGRIRLAGTTDSGAKRYRLTPDGESWLRTSTTNGVPA